jgi:hypothetical protein
MESEATPVEANLSVFGSIWFGVRDNIMARSVRAQRKMGKLENSAQDSRFGNLHLGPVNK